MRRLTIPEVLVALDQPDGKQRPPAGATALGGQGQMSAVEYARWFRSLTVQDRLEMARRG